MTCNLKSCASMSLTGVFAARLIVFFNGFSPVCTTRSVLPASLLRDPFAFFNGSSSKLSPRNVVAAIFKGAR